MTNENINLAIANLPLGASLDIYTDGSCISNPGPAGWGFVLVHCGEPIQTASAHLGPGTNNIAELTAAIEALRLFQARPDIIANIRSDSEYVVKGARERLPGWKNRGWKTADKKPVKNRGLWETLDGLAATLPNLAWDWVKGHDGHRFNEMADGLANAAARA